MDCRLSSANCRKNGEPSAENGSKDSGDNERSISPPARENTETDLNIGSHKNTVSHSSNNSNTQTLSGENIVLNREIVVDIPDANALNDEKDQDKEDMIAEMEKVVGFNDSVMLNDHNGQIGHELINIEIRKRYNNDRHRLGSRNSRLSRSTHRSRSEKTNYLDREDTVHHIPGCTYSWDNTVSTQCKTGFRPTQTNQFPRHSITTGPQSRAWSSRSKSRDNDQNADENLEQQMIPIPCGKRLFVIERNDDTLTDKSSYLTDRSDISSARNASRLALESREAMFRRAMSLLSARCTSVRQASEQEGDRVSLGAQVPKYFYVTQDKPLPMEPLKAWRGYHGNIYFEPININPLQSETNAVRAQTSITRQNTQPTMRMLTSVPKARNSFDKENRPIPENRSESRQTDKSSGSRRSSNRHMVFLDKQSVLNRLNDSIHEDIVWLEGTENTGSLAVRPKLFPERTSRERERDLQYNKERIRKGSVAHKIFIENRSKQKPRLSVNGDKFTPPHSLSPLLRTQTQYSLSNQRLTTNSPDPYHVNESKLPPLDQIRVSLKHMDSRRDSGGLQRGKVPYNRPVTTTDDMKPFVKYSPDVVAKMAQQTNMC